VNFSPRQFRRHNFVGTSWSASPLPASSPQRFQIEITETAIFDDVERAADTLFKLRQMGFRIALDDFGTGYSSLYNIRRFALDCLKIDRSFVDGMGRERESAAIVHSVIHLGRALGMEVVAEGVETPKPSSRRSALPAAATCRAIISPARWTRTMRSSWRTTASWVSTSPKSS
jgi:EAL domain-containing protein (putative c-di-GMP-specific phosphodiesterase class I)